MTLSTEKRVLAWLGVFLSIIAALCMLCTLCISLSGLMGYMNPSIDSASSPEENLQFGIVFGVLSILTFMFTLFVGGASVYFIMSRRSEFEE